MVLLVIVAGLAAGFVIWRSTADSVPDYQGAGDTEVIIRVQGGDAPEDIATTLADAGVVASAEAFEAQAAEDADVQALRPGYYRVRQNASAQADRGRVGGQGEPRRSCPAHPRPPARGRDRDVDRSQRSRRRSCPATSARSPLPPAFR